VTALPMISARVLGPMPAFLRTEAGSKGLNRANEAAGLPHGIEHEDNRFITQRSLMVFLDECARLVGDARVGLAFARHLTPAEYGVYGRYMLSGPTLLDALRRSRRALRWHSSRDELTVDKSGPLVRFAYRFGSAGAPTYENVAYCAAGVLLNLIRAYLGADWRPERIDLDLRHARAETRAQDVFGCQVRCGADRIGILMRPETLGVRAPRRSFASATLADVHRSRARRAPDGVIEVARELVRIQLMDSGVDLEATAERLGLGPRTLQRQLAEHGLQFRDLVTQVRVERARELLAERDLSITDVAAELGYSAPAHFARAFRRETGLSPRHYRRSRAAPAM
jgi:AraC-like DNA-binding protein